jgi:hypothetical protein
MKREKKKRIIYISLLAAGVGLGLGAYSFLVHKVLSEVRNVSENITEILEFGIINPDFNLDLGGGLGKELAKDAHKFGKIYKFEKRYRRTKSFLEEEAEEKGEDPDKIGDREILKYMALEKEFGIKKAEELYPELEDIKIDIKDDEEIYLE